MEDGGKNGGFAHSTGSHHTSTHSGALADVFTCLGRQLYNLLFEVVKERHNMMIFSLR
jgi:hypothetical protein